jgi:hypothetical protein
MNTNNSFWLRSLIPILPALSIAALHPAGAATLQVTNDGADSSSCGSQTAPCRSISQGIENASDGDTIYVGPGRYGNVNGGSTFSGPGDERPETLAAPWDGSGCIVCINKGLHVYSTAGAELTVIDSGGSLYQSTVLILSDGVDFGAAQHGFTITGGNAHGVTIEPRFSAQGVLRNISVSGNIDIGDGDGVFFFGDAFDGSSFRGCPPPPACTFSARVLIGDNRLLNNGNGVNVVLNDWGSNPGSVVIRDNQATNAGYGYWIFPGFAGGGARLSSSDNVQLVNNIAAKGNVGFFAVSTGPIQYNTAIDNIQSGFVLTPGGAPFTFNAALGNGGPGVLINLSPDPFDLGDMLSFQSFNTNTFVGNDRSRPTPLLMGFVGGGGSFDPGPSAHCGVLNFGPLGAVGGPTQVTPVPATQLHAANNYWGSANGPSTAGLGDAAGGVCDQNNATTVARPFLSTTPRSTTPLDP